MFAPPQAATLLLVGPLLDYWLTEKGVEIYDYNLVSVVSAMNINKIHTLVSLEFDSTWSSHISSC